MSEKEMCIRDRYNMMNNNFSELRGDINIKFNEQKNEIQEIKSSFNNKFEEQNKQFNELKFDIMRSKLSVRVAVMN